MTPKSQASSSLARPRKSLVPTSGRNNTSKADANLENSTVDDFEIPTSPPGPETQKAKKPSKPKTKTTSTRPKGEEEFEPKSHKISSSKNVTVHSPRARLKRKVAKGASQKIGGIAEIEEESSPPKQERRKVQAKHKQLSNPKLPEDQRRQEGGIASGPKAEAISSKEMASLCDSEVVETNALHHVESGSGIGLDESHEGTTHHQAGAHNVQDENVDESSIRGDDIHIPNNLTGAPIPSVQYGKEANGKDIRPVSDVKNLANLKKRQALDPFASKLNEFMQSTSLENPITPFSKCSNRVGHDLQASARNSNVQSPAKELPMTTEKNRPNKKRKGISEGDNSSKRQRAVQDLPANQVNVLTKTPIQVLKKPPMVSFGKSGPLNQGTSKRNARIKDVPIDPTSNVPQFDVGARSVIPQTPFEAADDDSTLFDHLQVESEVGPEPTSAHFQPKHSSQNTRVTATGSPLPSMHAHGSFPTDAEFIQDSPGIAHLEDRVSVEYNLPDNEKNAGHARLPSQAKGNSETVLEKILLNYSKNTKHQPSSPTIPSDSSSLSEHHMSQTGEIVNPRTNETIIPTKPHDPFVGRSLGSQTSFMRLLRETGAASKKRPSPQIADEEQNRPAKRRETSLEVRELNEDPDKTLIEDNQPPEKNVAGGNKTTSPPVSPADQEVRDAVRRQWTDKLNEYHQDIGRVLSETANVSSLPGYDYSDIDLSPAFVGPHCQE